MIRSYGCDKKERRLSWETGVEEEGLRCFLNDETIAVEGDVRPLL